ncbi:MAG: transposase [Deltaproteobacteria bacterium]|nr:transposase [Deltaproteobacteria bacterium]
MRRWWRWTNGRCSWWTRCGRPPRWRPAGLRAATTGRRSAAANVFCMVELKTGRHQTHATKNRTAAQFARALKRMAHSYPAARTIHLVLDNLSTHRDKSLTTSLGAQAGHRLWRRSAVHHTLQAR